MARSLGQKLGFALLWPGLFLYFIGSQRTRVIVVCGEEVLLIQDSTRYFIDDQAWTLPGGGIQRGEPASLAASRELYEELGISCEPENLILQAVQRSGGSGLSYRASFFELPLSIKPEISPLSKEVRSAHWFTINEIKGLKLKREAQQGLALLAR